MGAKLAGPSAGSKFNIEQNAEINVTPFVDVMLVLLIIFMVAAPLATVSVAVTLPEAIAPVQANPPQPVFISIQQTGAIFVGDFPTSLGALGDDLRTQIGTRNPERERIFIRGDRQVRYVDFMRVMNTLQDNGFYSVALIGTEGRS